MVWEGAEGSNLRVYLWDGARVRQISPEPSVSPVIIGDESHPQINNAGQVVWEASDSQYYQVYLWDGTQARQLTRNSGTEDIYPFQYPRINDLGQVVWQGHVGGQNQVFLWNGSTVQPLTSGSQSNNRLPCINNTGQIAWIHQDLSGSQISVWDHGSVRSIDAPGGNNLSDLQINDQGQMVWENDNGLNRQIYFWNGTASHSQGITPNGTPLSSTAFADLAQLSATGQVVWASFDGSDDEIYLYTPPVPGSLDLTATPVVEEGPVTGTVTLTAPAPAGGTVVALRSANPAAASVPASVTVPAGETSADFPVTTHLVPASTRVTLQAAASGAVWSAALQILHANLASFSLASSRVTGGQWVQATVMLGSEAPAGGATITVTRDPPAAMLPVALTVPAGTNQATCFVRTVSVARPVTATITAAYRGVSLRAGLQIDAPALTQLWVRPAAVTGGVSSTGFVSIGSAAPAGSFPVGLVSGDRAHVTVPLRVIVPEGATSASFPISTRSVTVATLVPIWAAAGQIQTATMWVLPVGLSFTPASVRGGRYTTGTIVLPAPAPLGGAVVTLSSGNPAVARPPASVTVPAGTTTVTFAVRTFPVASSTTVTLSAAASGLSWTRSLTVTP